MRLHQPVPHHRQPHIAGIPDDRPSFAGGGPLLQQGQINNLEGNYQDATANVPTAAVPATGQSNDGTTDPATADLANHAQQVYQGVHQSIFSKGAPSAASATSGSPDAAYAPASSGNSGGPNGAYANGETNSGPEGAYPGGRADVGAPESSTAGDGDGSSTGIPDESAPQNEDIG